MSDFVECSTQKDVDTVVKNGDIPVVRSGFFDVTGSASVSAFGSASVRASDSASVSASGWASVSAFDSASVSASGWASVSAFDSASVSAFDSASVSAFGSASVSAFGSASVSASGSASVRAFDSASVSAFDSASVRATPFVAVQRTGKLAKVDGGVLIQIPEIKTTEQFFEYYGIKATRGTVTLYKLVDDKYLSAHGTSYKPGQKPSASDWDSEPCCGSGLHFSPRAFMARKYASPKFERFVACKVKVADIVVIDDYGTPDKIKSPRCEVLFACDEDGEKVPA
jgi:hypothetical protein